MWVVKHSGYTSVYVFILKMVRNILDIDFSAVFQNKSVSEKSSKRLCTFPCLFNISCF